MEALQSVFLPREKGTARDTPVRSPRAAARIRAARPMTSSAAFSPDSPLSLSLPLASLPLSLSLSLPLPSRPLPLPLLSLSLSLSLPSPPPTAWAVPLRGQMYSM